MTGDPPLLFSRSWRRNFKDPGRGQKHSLGLLIITTGVPLFGRGVLFWVQNCSAGVPREAPFNFPAYLRRLLFLLLLLLLKESLLFGAPSCAHPLPLIQSIDPRISSSSFTSSLQFDRRLSIFSCLARFGNNFVLRDNRDCFERQGKADGSTDRSWNCAFVIGIIDHLLRRN